MESTRSRTVNIDEGMLLVDAVDSAVESSAIQYDGYRPADGGSVAAPDYQPENALQTGGSKWRFEVSRGKVHPGPHFIQREV